ncbi:PPE-repeat proteins [Flavonifractor plautii]|nr:PPE-repeat proteins [Flavonifractor plautii]
MSETGVVKGFKVFNPDWTCNPNGKPFQYEVGGIYEEDVKPMVCDRGFHFCEKAADCFNYYQFNPENRVAEVIALGEVDSDGTKSCTNKIQIVREIPWQELLEIVNTGKGCTGLCNSGDCNSGDWNSGNRNSGDWNSGNRNSGNRNSGDWNSGNRNSGDWNSGDWNSGDWNSGDWNSGNRNSGDWNKTNFSNGCFNTVEPKIYLFNKPSEWTYRDWLNSEARYLLNQIPGDVLEYIWLDDMTDEEKAAHPEAETTGGYLKVLDNSECAVIWWRGLSDRQKNIIAAIPNFDKAIFKEITGIDVDEN